MSGLVAHPTSTVPHSRLLTSAAGALVLAGVLALAAVGAVAAPAATAIGASAGALVAGVVTAYLHPRPGRATWVAAASGGLVVPFLTGVGTLGPGGSAVVGFLILGAVWTGRAVVVASTR